MYMDHSYGYGIFCVIRQLGSAIAWSEPQAWTLLAKFFLTLTFQIFGPLFIVS